MCTGRGSNEGPLGPKSDALTTAPLRHLWYMTLVVEIADANLLSGSNSNICTKRYGRKRMYHEVWFRRVCPVGHCLASGGLLLHIKGERGGLVVNSSDSGSRGRGFESHSGQTVLCP